MDKSKFYDIVRANMGTLTQPQVDGYETLINAGLKYKTELNQLAYILATTWLETAWTMQPITEYGEPSYFKKYEPPTEKAAELGNTQPGDGEKYKGRGFVMITGRSNYTRATNELGHDFVNVPTDACVPSWASQIIFKGMMAGWFTGKKLPDYVSAVQARKDYHNARKVVNGLDRAGEIAAFAETYEAGLIAAGYDPNEPYVPTPEPKPEPGPTPVPPVPQPIPTPPVDKRPSIQWVMFILSAIGFIAAAFFTLFK